MSQPINNTIDLLAEQVISNMIATNRSAETQAVTESFLDRFPKITFRIDGQTITADQIALNAKRSIEHPALGSSFLQGLQPKIITGSPIKPTTRIDPGGIVLYAPQLGRIEYVRVGGSTFESFWSIISKTTEPPIIPWQDEQQVLILWPEGVNTNDNNDTGTLQSLKTSSGNPLWTIENIRTKLARGSKRTPDEIARIDTQFVTPTQGLVPLHQLMIVTDGHTIIVSDRIGHAMGVDFFTGEQLWKTDLPANRINDLDLAGGVLGICGTMHTDETILGQDGQVVSIAAAIDPRTGEVLQLVDRFGQSPRWVRVANTGNLFIATTQRLIAINTKEGAIDWTIKDDILYQTGSGWLFDDHLIVLDESTNLWAINTNNGLLDQSPLETNFRIAQSGWVRAHTTRNRLVFLSSLGLNIFDQSHQLLASDSINPQMPLVDFAWGRDQLIALQRPAQINDQSVAQLYLIDQSDARLLDTTQVSIPLSLDRQPTSLTAITGGVLIGYNEVSVFVRTQSDTQ